MNWYKLDNKKPIATERGCWDGLKSDKVLVATRGGKMHIAEMYEGFLDASDFCDFYDANDYEIKNVVYWTEIDSPF
jgi:hypothetical protein